MLGCVMGNWECDEGSECARDERAGEVRMLGCVRGAGSLMKGEGGEGGREGGRGQEKLVCWDVWWRAGR